MAFNFETSEEVTIDVWDAQGKLVTTPLQVIATQQTILFPIQSEAQGIYLVTVTGASKTWTKKIAINR